MLVNVRLSFNIYTIIFEIFGLKNSCSGSKSKSHDDNSDENINQPNMQNQMPPYNNEMQRRVPEDPYYQSSDYNPQLANIPSGDPSQQNYNYPPYPPYPQPPPGYNGYPYPPPGYYYYPPPPPNANPQDNNVPAPKPE